MLHLSCRKNTLHIDTQQLTGSTTDLYLDQRNRNVLFLNRLFLSHMQHGNKCAVRSIAALSFFLISLPLRPSLSVYLSPSHTFHLFCSLTLLRSLTWLCTFSVSRLCYFCLSHRLAFPLFFPLICFFLFPFASCLSSPQVPIPPPSRWALTLDILPLHLQLRLNWAEHICLRSSLKRERERERERDRERERETKKIKYNSHERWPPRAHHKLDSKQEGTSPWNPLFSTLFGGGKGVWGEQGSPRREPEPEAERGKALWWAHYLKKKWNKLVWPKRVYKLSQTTVHGQ